MVRALSIGPAASLALSSGALRVHGVFSSAVNLEAVGAQQRFLSLCGPGGAGLPHAVALERLPDLDASRLAVGAPVRVRDDAIELPVRGGELTVNLRSAERSQARPLPSITRLGAAHRSCARALAVVQREKACDLRIEGLSHGEREARAPLGARLRDAALALGAAAGGGTSLREEVAALVGLGAGLTPSGDDFLCGFLAAARASSPALVQPLSDAIESSAARTGALSAFLLRCAVQGFWPGLLVDMAEALARGDKARSLLGLRALCALGHSSGSDLATGFLFGLEALGRGALLAP